MRSLISLLILSAGLLYSGLVTAQATFPNYVEPSYSNLTLAYTQADFEDYSPTADDLSIRFEQRLMPTIYVSGQFHEFSEAVDNHAVGLELEDAQLGIGWMDRSQVGPHVDASVLIGRETYRRPNMALPGNQFYDESNYFGLQIGLREVHGPLELHAGAAYLFHDSEQDNQIRWHVTGYINLWANLSVGLRYQDNDWYSLRSVELRLRW
ncbi:hypothetical protein CWE12_10780 [Aliidiomarina sedimenti]|uniref:Outer membrane protein beta-barrel domain-containing protein n=1 Tax=Aliidiomarina sedimenti TaxID=1933879 RepID=A0ABY0BWN2_9GAMM|nr:hypothetical protein [Aliidiomarina sedimenti]RUO28789.1 hypothetical protein CWE12_10780 [Aliidiomarina sedimenti]